MIRWVEIITGPDKGKRGMVLEESETKGVLVEVLLYPSVRRCQAYSTKRRYASEQLRELRV